LYFLFTSCGEYCTWLTGKRVLPCRHRVHEDYMVTILAILHLILNTYSTRKTRHDDYHLRGSQPFVNALISTKLLLTHL